MYGQKAFDIVGYTFNADNYCPNCIIDVLPTGDNEAFGGWQLANGIKMSVEDNLSEIAYAFSINRNDESSFDSDEFPKVIFADSEWDIKSVCGSCH